MLIGKIIQKHLNLVGIYNVKMYLGELTLEELDKIPKKYRTHSKILRSEIVELDFDRINTQEKKVELIFKDL